MRAEWDRLGYPRRHCVTRPPRSPGRTRRAGARPARQAARPARHRDLHRRGHGRVRPSGSATQWWTPTSAVWSCRLFWAAHSLTLLTAAEARRLAELAAPRGGVAESVGRGPAVDRLRRAGVPAAPRAAGGARAGRVRVRVAGAVLRLRRRPGGGVVARTAGRSSGASWPC
ncbi:hypothetical protein QJS66_09935 [Kocuria rhizophila]|nr:hypothetical protein QJS66_09935 [Kocuria rhizophila]